jgi:DNA-binding NtrC family response regulator
MSETMAPAAKPGLLLVDDDPLIRDTLSLVLGRHFDIHCAASHESAMACVDRLDPMPALALVDLGLPPEPHRATEGYRLIDSLLGRLPDMKIVVLSGQAEEASGRHARARGAFEFVAKPAAPKELLRVLDAALAAGDAERSDSAARADDTPVDLIGDSAPMRALKAQISLYADSPFPVLVEGESGSGKELVAAALHAQSGRQGKAFLALNCAAIAPSLVEPTLFGYAKGAFTGAITARAGYFEEARNGTLFLDEIGELPLELQAKLLRVLENGEYNRVGETQARKSLSRIIAATNRDLRGAARSGGFRNDLYHRLSVLTVQVPALRDLGEDKFLLLDHFAALYAPAAGAGMFGFDEGARRLWLDYPFPGNVRELRNIVIRLVTKFKGRVVGSEELEAELDSGATLAQTGAESADIDTGAIEELRRHGDAFRLDARLAAWERAYVAAAMKLAGGNVSQAARLLGLNRTTLYSRMAALERES